MEAIILAGGYGIRLQSVMKNLPKPMATINGRPFLEYLLDFLHLSGISHVVLSVGYKREAIIDHFKSSYRGITIDYAAEEEPMGTGGGIRLAMWKIKGKRALVLNGDSIFRVDVKQMTEEHLRKKADVTIALREADETFRYGRVTFDHNMRITGFTEKNGKAGQGYINGGVYVLEKGFLMEPHFRGRFSIEKDCFESCYNAYGMYGFASTGYFIDIGIPEALKRAQDEFRRFQD